MNQLSTLLDMISNPDKYQEKITELEKTESKINAKLKTIKNASEIDSLHERAKKLTLEAEARLKAANQKTDELLTKASEEAESILTNARNRADNMVNQALKKEQQATKLKEKLDKQSIEQNKLQTQLDVTNQAQQQRENDLQQRENRVKAKEAILEQLKA